MSQEIGQTALVCEGEVDSDEEEPPTPRVLDPHAGPAPAVDRNVFFQQKQTSDESGGSDFPHSDSYCDGPTPTTEGYKALCEEEESEKAPSTDDGQTSIQPCSNKSAAEHDITSSRSMTESSDIEIIRENSSSSIEVLESPMPSKQDYQNMAKETVMANGSALSGTVSSFSAISSSHEPRKGAVKQEVKYRQITDKQSCTSDNEIKTGGDKASNNQTASNGIANGTPHRPHDLSLPKPLKAEDPKSKLKHKHSESDIEVFEDDYPYAFRDTDKLIEAVASTPLRDQGTVSQDGDMVAFVAEDLQEKIRMSSPASRTDSHFSSRYGSRTPSSRSMSSLNSYSSSSASGWSGVSTSGGMSRSPSVLTQSPEDMPPVDPRAVCDLDIHARKVAESLEVMMKNLRVNLHKMSGFTGQALLAYQDGVDNTCDSVDATIKSMYALMAKCEELSKAMTPVYELAEQIKEIKRLLELFEGQLVKED